MKEGRIHFERGFLIVTEMRMLSVPLSTPTPLSQSGINLILRLKSEVVVLLRQRETETERQRGAEKTIAKGKDRVTGKEHRETI